MVKPFLDGVCFSASPRGRIFVLIGPVATTEAHMVFFDA